MSVTRIEDARTMKAVGWPLDTPVEDGVMSEGTTMHYNAVMEAHTALGDARKHEQFDSNSEQVFCQRSAAPYERTNRIRTPRRPHDLT